jgi:hypothetical protein
MRRLLLLPVLGALPLAGCGSVLSAGTTTGAGIASAGIANSFTKNASVATAIGLGVAAGAEAGLQYAERRVHAAEQDRIAQAAGGLAPGVVGQWSVSHDVPIEDDEHGAVVVTRDLAAAGGGGAADFACREIVFSVDSTEHHQPRRDFYTATVCRDGNSWKWATAEPATARWGSLQ